MTVTEHVDLDHRVPVLTGSLSSDKATLPNRVLVERSRRPIAGIGSKFGAVGVAHARLFGAEEEVFETNNGCICGTVRGDRIRMLGVLIRSERCGASVR